MILVSPFQVFFTTDSWKFMWEFIGQLLGWLPGSLLYLPSCDSCIMHRFTCCPKISIYQVSNHPRKVGGFAEFSRKSHRTCKWLEPVKSFWSSHSKTLVSMAWWSRGCVGWLVFFRMDGKTIEHISLLGHSSGGCRGGGAFCSYISGSGPFEKALQNRYSHSQKPRWNHLSPVVAAKNGAWVDKYIRNIISSMKRWPSVTVPWWSNRNPIIQQFQKHPKTGELPGWPHCWWFRNPQMFHLLSMFHPACKKWGICSISYWSLVRHVHLYRINAPKPLDCCLFQGQKVWIEHTSQSLTSWQNLQDTGVCLWKTLGFSLKDSPYSRW